MSLKKLLPLGQLKTEIYYNHRLSSNSLSLTYKIIGNLPFTLNTDNIPKYLRKDELWHRNCFEFFIRSAQSNEYLEFNLSPEGNWNVFHFESYRKNKKEAQNFSLESYQCKSLSSGHEFSYKLKGSSLFSPGLRHGTCILKKQGKYHYFNELGFIGRAPDFHLFKGTM